MTPPVFLKHTSFFQIQPVWATVSPAQHSDWAFVMSFAGDSRDLSGRTGRDARERIVGHACVNVS